MDYSTFERWLQQPGRSQREKLTSIRELWLDRFGELPEQDRPRIQRLIRKKINSKKLKGERDALLAEIEQLRFSGAAPEPAEAPAEAPAASADATGDGGRNPALEAAIVADPEAREPYLIYGDWLAEQGDPRGELIAIQHELGKSPGHKKMLRAQEELLAREGEALLGPLRHCQDMLDQLRWQMGFIAACRLRSTMERFNGELPNTKVTEALGWLLDDPGPARFIQQLTVGIVTFDDNDYSAVCQLLGARPRPTLRSLYLGDFGYEETELNWSTIGDASPLYAGTPRLRELTLRSGSMQLGEIALPELRSFTTITGGLDDAAARAIAAAHWPQLERLSLQFGRPSYGATDDVAVVEPILAGRGIPRLSHLGLTNCEFTDALCAALPGSAVLPQLRQLDLSMGTMSDEGALQLVHHAAAFAQLEQLDVSDNYLSERGAAALQGICAEVVIGEQRDDEGEAGNRYASAVE